MRVFLCLQISRKVLGNQLTNVPLFVPLFVPLCKISQCLKSLREGDVLIVWKLDRLGRSLQHLIEVVNDLEVRNIGFQSITENIDTTSSTGKLIFHIFGSLAEFERGLIRDRVKAGLEAAKKRGKEFGRPDALDDRAKERLSGLISAVTLWSKQ